MKELTNPTSPVVSPERASGFQQARKKLRDARIAWIDKHEAPQAMEVRDASGNTILTPFFVGQAPSASPEDFFGGTVDKHRDPAKQNFTEGKKGLSEVEDSLDETIREYLKIDGVVVSGKPGDKMAFVSEVDRPQHPAMLEGESHEEWYARVSSSYLKTEQSTDTGRAGSGVDGLRESSADDSGEQRSTPPAGGEDSDADRENLDRNAERNDHVRQSTVSGNPYITIAAAAHEPSEGD